MPSLYWLLKSDIEFEVDACSTIRIHNKEYEVDTSMIGCVCRHPLPGDMYGSTKLMSYLSKKRIPIFLRN